MGRALCAVVAAAVVVLGGVAAPTDGKTDGPTLGLLHGYPNSTLVRLDPHSLRALEGSRLDVGGNTFAWSFSPDRSRLALGGDRAGTYVPEVLLVDTRKLRALGRVQLADTGWVVATAWLGGRLRAVVTTTGTTIVTVDPARRKVVASRRIDLQLLHVAYGRDSLVLLLAPQDATGAARVAVVRASGAVDVAVLDRVQAARTSRVTNIPALAVDPDRNRAFVVPARGEVAQVDLDALRVSYHGLSQRVPQTRAKSTDGPVRHARWLGNGLIAVSGGDYSVDGERHRFTPAGVRVVDTRDWRAWTFARGADGFRLAGVGQLLAFSAIWSSELHLPRPFGVAAYRLDGRKHFHLHEGARAWIFHADERRAYVDPAGPGPVEVVDMATGRVERRESVPWPLDGDAASAID